MRPTTLTTIALGISLVGGLLPLDTMAQDPLDVTPTATLDERLAAAIADDASALAGDPRASREFVAARIGYAEYDGVLKGAVGAYLTGTGNGADQALLLAELLGASASALATRFAVCVPGEALAAELSAQAADSEAGRGLALDHLEEIRDQIEDTELATAVSEVLELRSDLQLDAARDADRLSGALFEAGYVAPESDTSGGNTHVWLQAQIDGGWVDLDTTSADGSARCEVERTLEALDETRQHLVRFVVSAEQRTDGILETSELIDAGFPTADLAASRISLLFAEPADLIEEADPASALASYTPMLLIDGESLPASGSIELPRPAETLGGGIADTVGGLGGLFDELPSSIEEDETDDSSGGLFGGDDGGLFGGVGGAEEVSAAEPTAMWLDIELMSPDGDLVTRRIELFDRIGVAARAAGDEAAADLEPLEEVAGEYAPTATVWQVGLLVGEATAAEAAEVGAFDPSTIESYAEQLDAQLRTFPAMHRDMGGKGTFPALLVASLGPALDPDSQPVTSLAFDAAYIPSAPPLDEQAAAFDALAVMTAERMLGAVAGTDDGTAADSGAILAGAWADSVELVSLAPGDSADLVTASPGALARIEARLQDGYSVLVPERPVSVDGVPASAWWVIDAASGVVRDEHENGRHSESAEYTINTGQSLSTMDRFRRFGCRIARPVATAALLLFLGTGAGGGSPLYEPLSEVVEAANAAREAEAGRKAAEQAACALG